MKMRKFQSGAAILVLLFLAGCGAVRRQSIADIHADPGRYTSGSNTISGTVVRSYGLWKWGAFELDDSTGRIWVIARNSTPAEGSRVEVHGHALSAFNLPFIRFTGTVFQEDSRRARDR
jgi:hypothetical protein